MLEKIKSSFREIPFVKKDWLDKVSVKVSGEEAKGIINILLHMLSDFLTMLRRKMR